MDVAVELSLLQKRFTGAGIEGYGTLRSEFVCARRMDVHTYEGRLFLMDRALLFVSTYADSHDYDVIITCSDIEHITALHKTIPTIEIALLKPKGNETFCNFHNYSAVLSALGGLLPHVPVERKTSASFKAVSSAPSTPAAAATCNSTNPLGLQACPFYAKALYCPRMPLCKLDHSLSTDLSKRSSKKQPLLDCLSGHAGSAKRPHIDHPPNNDQLPPGVRGAPVLAYSRSVSLPFPLAVLQSGGVSSDKKACLQGTEPGEEVPAPSVTTPFVPPTPIVVPITTSPLMSAEGSDVASNIVQDGETSTEHMNQNLGVLQQQNLAAVGVGQGTTSQDENTLQSQCLVKEVGLGTASQGLEVGLGTASQGLGTTPHCLGTVEQAPGAVLQLVDGAPTPPPPPPPLPPSFNFYKAADTSQEGLVTPGAGLFVFNSKPADTDVVPGQGVAPVGPPPPPGGGATPPPDLVPPEVSTATSDSEVAALLAQQLLLDSSDEDFDIESQKVLLERFTRAANQPPATSGEEGAADGEGRQVDTSGTSGEVRKRPCYYFMTGYCRDGASCPNYHGTDFADMSDSDLMPQSGELSLPDALSVYSANSVGRQDLNCGDKIILSPFILMACEQKEMEYPMSFKLENKATGAYLYAGVLDFTSPIPEQAFIPQWMMDHLGASDGTTVSFEHVNLPKGTFVKLQPVSSVWLGIPYDKRMAMMEFQLRNFQTLTEGTKVTLNYENNRYTLKVLECRPNKGISIVDADITTDILEPADFSRFHSIEEGQGERIELEEPVLCATEAGAYRHFVLLSLPGQPLPPRLRIEVKATKGDPDLFLCQNCVAPTQRRYTWCAQDVGSADFYISVDSDTDYDVTRPLYAGVAGLCEDAQFTICLHREDTLAAAKARVNKSSNYFCGRKQNASSTDETDSAPPPGHERCSYCGSVMPSLRLLMHQKHCAQSTFKCSICGMCLPKAAECKHHKIAHELIRCDCGLELTQLDLHIHQKSDCIKKSIKCSFKWCNLSFPLDQLEHHESICARKNVTCPMCSVDVTQLELEQHLQALHSVDISKINWLAPLASQLTSVAPPPTINKLQCVCNHEFQFQDDLEVHQLTECPLLRMSEDSPAFVD